jgi:glycerol kinase
VVAETTALGAAYAAGLAVGYWPTLEDLRQNWQIAHTWTPNMDEATRAQMYKGWLKAVQRSMKWLED